MGHNPNIAHLSQRFILSHCLLRVLPLPQPFSENLCGETLPFYRILLRLSTAFFTEPQKNIYQR
jgi:hypothetical protein